MEIKKRQDAGVITFEIEGEIDLHASPVLRQELQSALAEKAPVLLIDFTLVSYIDSSGLATLIEYVRDCPAHGGKMALFGLQKKVRTIFEMVRLNELFVITDSFEQALDKVAAA